MKKAKTLETKLRSAIRLIWSRSKERRAIVKAAIVAIPGVKDGFMCPVCRRGWPIQMAEVDHDPAIGTLASWKDIANFIDKMFFGPQRAICKLCHRRKTTEDRKKMRKQ